MDSESFAPHAVRRRSAAQLFDRQETVWVHVEPTISTSPEQTGKRAFNVFRHNGLVYTIAHRGRDVSHSENGAFDDF